MARGLKRFFLWLFRRRRRQAKRLADQAIAQKQRGPIEIDLDGHKHVLGEDDWNAEKRTREDQERYDALVQRNIALKHKNQELLARNALLLDMVLLGEVDIMECQRKIQDMMTEISTSQQAAVSKRRG
mmetsp:Transcript_60151/g.130649  ORF Transcript_60151/g.130649 Transcript_60151/m.130649 type:complete len:128 (-) Transcript_60151:110-493(-)